MLILIIAVWYLPSSSIISTFRDSRTKSAKKLFGCGCCHLAFNAFSITVLVPYYIHTIWHNYFDFWRSDLTDPISIQISTNKKHLLTWFWSIKFNSIIDLRLSDLLLLLFILALLRLGLESVGRFVTFPIVNFRSRGTSVGVVADMAWKNKINKNICRRIKRKKGLENEIRQIQFVQILNF
jgi:hypothetical protein